MIRKRFAPVPLRAAALATLSLVTVGCGGGEPAAEAEGVDASVEAAPATITVAEVGFATPESVLHEPAADVYLVSNINGSPLEKDGNGFISRLSPDGEVLALKWIDGAAEGVTLNAPKGMAVEGSTLYVADIDCIRMFDVGSGAPTGELCPEGATFLNDVAAFSEGGGVLFTDSGLDATFTPTGADAVYHMMGDRAVPAVRDPAFGAPNGVAVGGPGVYVVTFMSGQVFQVTGENERSEVAAVEGGQFDGIEFLEDGRALISDWGASCVHVLDTDGTLGCAFGDLEAPADIGVDRARNRLLVPLFNADEVRIIPLG